METSLDFVPQIELGGNLSIRRLSSFEYHGWDTATRMNKVLYASRLGYALSITSSSLAALQTFLKKESLWLPF